MLRQVFLHLSSTPYMLLLGLSRRLAQSNRLIRVPMLHLVLLYPKAAVHEIGIVVVLKGLENAAIASGLANGFMPSGG